MSVQGATSLAAESSTATAAISVVSVSNIKLDFKYGFGYTLPASKLDPILSFAAVNGDKDFSDRMILKMGKQACIYNVETKKQEYFDRPKNYTDISHFAISANCRFISMCELIHSEKLLENTSVINVYSLTSLNRLKTLTYPSLTKPLICSTFCGDVKQIAALSDDADRLIIVWQWEKERVIKTISLSMSVHILRAAPSTALMLTTSGNGVLKNWCVATDGAMKPNNFLPTSREEKEHFIDHLWLPSITGLHRMVAIGDIDLGSDSTAANRVRKQVIYIFEGRDNAHPSNAGNFSSPMPITTELKQTVVLRLEIGSKIEKVCASSKLFAVVGSFGLVIIYERSDDKHDPYIETRRLSLGELNFVAGSILPSDEKIILLTRTNRLLAMSMDMTIDQLQLRAGLNSDSVSLNSDDASHSTTTSSVTKDKRNSINASNITDFTPGGYHCNSAGTSLLGADLAYERPYLITIGADSSARIWNYTTMKCEMTHYFELDEPISVAFHPNGFQVLVSFKDRVRLYNVLMDKLRQCKETILKNSRCLKFSNGSQYWAAATAVSVCIYDTKSFQKLITYQGHMMQVIRLSWAPGDQVLFSAGMDGNVYGWPIAKDGRMDIIAASNRSSLIFDLTVDSPSTVFKLPDRDDDEEEDNGNGNGGGNTVAAATTTSTTEIGLSSEASEVDDNNRRVNLCDRYKLIVSSQDGSMRMPSWSLDNNLVRVSNGIGRSASMGDSLEVISGHPNAAITAVQLSFDRKKLYAGTILGTIRVYPWPPINYATKAKHNNSSMMFSSTAITTVPSNSKVDDPYYEIFTHGGPVIAIKLSPVVENTVITVAADGTIFVLEDVVFTVQGNKALKKEIDYLDTSDDEIKFNDDIVMIASEDMEEHISELVGLQKELIETKAKHEFHTRKVASDHAENMKSIVENHDLALNKERESYENYKSASEKRIADFISSVEAKDADNQKIRSELENKYEHKLAESLERYDLLSEKMQQLKQKCEALLENEKNTFNKQLNDLKMDTYNKEKKLKTDHRRAVEDKAANEAAFMEILKQQEDEYEDELKQMIEAVNYELGGERETILKLRTLVQTKNTKLAQLKKKLIELNASAQGHAKKVEAEVNERKALASTIEHYKKNLQEREEALAEKEKDVLELRSTTRTLENFRFVLDHRLQQLSSERGPITMHIEGLEKHISTMYEELVEEFTNKKSNAEATILKDQKIAWITQDLAKMRQNVREKEQYITAFKRELNNIVTTMVHGKELEESVKLLYRKFVRGENDARSKFRVNDRIQEKVNDLLHDGDGEDHTVVTVDTHTHGGKLCIISTVTFFVSLALNCAYMIGKNTKYSTGGNHNHNDETTLKEVEEALIESAKEADRQKLFVEKQSENLKRRLHSVKGEAHSLGRRRLNENSNLLFECNDLRMETKELSRKLAIKTQELEVAQRTINLLKTDVANTEKHPSTKSHSRSSSPTRTMAAGLLDDNRPKPMNSASAPLLKEVSQKWIVHNALNINAQTPKDSEGTMYQSLNGTNAPMSPGENNRVGSSQSAPHLSKTTTSQMITKTSSSQSQSNKNHMMMSREGTANGINNNNSNNIKSSEKAKRNNVASLFSQTSAEWQVDKLTKEVTSLALQLDESLREREQQRLEILRLRKHFMSISNNRVPNSTSMVIVPNSLQLPSIISNNNINHGAVGESISISLNGNSSTWKDTGGRHITNADLYGIPSSADKQDLQLMPTDGSLASTSGELASKKIVGGSKNFINAKRDKSLSKELQELSLNSGTNDV